MSPCLWLSPSVLNVVVHSFSYMRAWHVLVRTYWSWLLHRNTWTPTLLIHWYSSLQLVKRVSCEQIIWDLFLHGTITIMISLLLYLAPESVHVCSSLCLRGLMNWCCVLILPQDGQTPLHLAAVQGNLSVVEILLEHMAAVSPVDRVSINVY